MAPKYTEKGLEEQLSRHINARRTKLSQLTSKTNKTTGLMKDNESPDIVDEHLNSFSKLLKDFIHANDDVLSLLPDEEKDADRTFWFNPKKEQFNKCMTEVDSWIATTRQQHQEDVSPDDSVSVIGAHAKKTSGSHVARSTASSLSSRSSRVSSLSSTRQKEQAECAALLACAAALKQRQALDLAECKLKAKKEPFEIETDIAGKL